MYFHSSQQAVLIRQLQEQHYHQYMQQLLHQQMSGGDSTNENGEECSVPNLANENITYYTNGNKTLPMATSTGTIISNGDIEDGDHDRDEERSLGIYLCPLIVVLYFTFDQTFPFCSFFCMSRFPRDIPSIYVDSQRSQGV